MRPAPTRAVKETEAMTVLPAEEPSSSVQRAIPVQSEEQTKALLKEFERGLIEMDERGGSRLAETFRQACEIHHNNTFLRANLIRMQSVLEEQHRMWVKVKTKLGSRIDELDVEDENFHSDMHAILDLNDRTTKMVTTVTGAIREVAKEIRQTEFSDRFHFHVAIVQQFVDGMKSVIFRELRGSPELMKNVLNGMKKLSRIFEIQEQQ